MVLPPVDGGFFVGNKMKAKDLVAQYGENLIGKRVFTQPMGEYPGGVAKVVKLWPDGNASEIVMVVDHPKTGEIGVFENEEIIRIDDVERIDR